NVPEQAVASIAAHAEAIATQRAARDSYDETTRRFVCPGLLRANGTTLVARAVTLMREEHERTLDALERHAIIDETLRASLGAVPELSPALDEAVGVLAARLPRRDLDDGELARLSELSMASVSDIVDAATEVVGMARHVRLNYHVFDRRLETLAITFQV